MMKKGHWTKPYYGVQHYVLGSKHRPQFTIEDHKSFVLAYVLPLTGFTPFREETFDKVSAAKKWIEHLAENLERYELND